jgi:hypothetical protein
VYENYIGLPELSVKKPNSQEKDQDKNRWSKKGEFMFEFVRIKEVYFYRRDVLLIDVETDLDSDLPV